MDKIVKQQLSQCTYADLSNFDACTNTYRIKKYTKATFDVGKCYLIKVSRSIVGNTDSVTATNWNNGTAPQHEYYKAYVSRSLGKMVYCDCLAFDYNAKCDLTSMWSGWLSIDDITQLSII